MIFIHLNKNFIDGNLDAFGKVAQSGGDVTVGSLVELLEKAADQMKQNDIEGASESIQKLRNSWLQIEGIVLTQSSTVYTSMERDMVTAYAQLTAVPAQVGEASATIARMHADLQPLAAKTSYTMLDATTILLREGLEALLVIIALLGFQINRVMVIRNNGFGMAYSEACSLVWRLVLLFNSCFPQVHLGTTTS